MSEPKFKPGDKVRCLETSPELSKGTRFLKGQIYTVYRCGANGHISAVEVYGDGSHDGHYTSSVEVFELAETHETKGFHLVPVTKDDVYEVGQVYALKDGKHVTVSKVHVEENMENWARFDDLSGEGRWHLGHEQWPGMTHKSDSNPITHKVVQTHEIQALPVFDEGAAARKQAYLEQAIF